MDNLNPAEAEVSSDQREDGILSTLSAGQQTPEDHAPGEDTPAERPPSLVMRRPHLNALPPLPVLPSSYTLRTSREDDLRGLTAVLQTAFPEMTWTRQETHKALIADENVKRTFVIEHDGRIVATTTVLLAPEKYPDSGVVHWVGADPAHKGKRLGYTVVLATLHEFARMGCKDAVLLTDDFRLPAIKTYLNLGFVPEHSHESHPQRWNTIYAHFAEITAPASSASDPSPRKSNGEPEEDDSVS